MENTKHRLETGDSVTFREVVGMTAINGTTHTIKGEHLLLEFDKQISRDLLIFLQCCHLLSLLLETQVVIISSLTNMAE